MMSPQVIIVMPCWDIGYCWMWITCSVATCVGMANNHHHGHRSHQNKGNVVHGNNRNDLIQKIYQREECFVWCDFRLRVDSLYTICLEWEKERNIFIMINISVERLRSGHREMTSEKMLISVNMGTRHKAGKGRKGKTFFRLERVNLCIFSIRKEREK